MFPRRYFARRYFAPRYFPQSQGQVPAVYAGRIEYTAENQRIDWRAESSVIGYTVAGQRIDWRADR